MKVIPYFTILLFLVSPMNGLAQGFLKSDYLASSPLKNKNGDKFGSGDLFKVSGRYTLPLSVKQNTSGQISLWSATFSGSYGIFDNKKIIINTMPDDIINASFNISHVRPLSRKWYMVASLGGGIYSELDKISAKSILINGGVFFVYKLMNNLDVGIGACVTNSYGVPIIIPTSYLKWQLAGKYKIKVDIASNMEISASIKFNDKFNLKLVAIEMDGISAVMDIDNKSMIYSSTNMKSYLTPEYQINKLSTLYMGVGDAWLRTASLSKRTLKGFWETFKKDDNDYHFYSTVYLTVGFKFGF